MQFEILSFKSKKRVPDRKKFFKKKKDKDNDYKISIEYNIDEDRFYYNDGEKNIPTKKDLAHSILIIYDIFKRYEKLGFKDIFVLDCDNLDWFLQNFTSINNNENESYIQKMLFGSKPISLMTLNYVCKQLKIANDVIFEDYYYDDIEFY